MKKLSSILKMMALVAPIMFAACSSHKKAVSTTTTLPTDTTSRFVVRKVNSNAHNADFVTAKIKFTVSVGNMSQTLTGNLKMRRDSVIRLQLMAFGFVEAGRLEFTPETALLMDRINKQFLRVPYQYVEFLRKSGINFHTLQALFWNELFLPGHKSLTDDDLDLFKIERDPENTILSFNQDKMTYTWLTDTKNGIIKMSNILYTPLQGDNTQLNWDYRGFTKLNGKSFPNDMQIELVTPEKKVNLTLKLNYLGNDSDWDLHTVVSNKYQEVDVDQILRRFMAF